MSRSSRSRARSSGLRLRITSSGLSPRSRFSTLARARTSSSQRSASSSSSARTSPNLCGCLALDQSDPRLPPAKATKPPASPDAGPRKVCGRISTKPHHRSAPIRTAASRDYRHSEQYQSRTGPAKVGNFRQGSQRPTGQPRQNRPVTGPLPKRPPAQPIRYAPNPKKRHFYNPLD